MADSNLDETPALTRREKYERGDPLETALATKNLPTRTAPSEAVKIAGVTLVTETDSRETCGVAGNRFLVFSATAATHAKALIYRTASGATWKQDPRDADMRVFEDEAILHIPDHKPIKESA